MSPLDKFLLFVALPIVVASSFVEALLLARRGAYDWRATGVSLADLAARVTINIALPLSIATPLLYWAVQHKLTTIPLDTGWAIAALFLGQEFFYYGFHRASHRVRWFW